MKRGGLLRRGVQSTFDAASGKIVGESKKTQGKVSAETRGQYFRLKWLEGMYFKWLSIGRDMRMNLLAVLACGVCFSVVFFPANYYDERQWGIQLKGRLPKESLDKGLYKEYLQEKGRIVPVQWDVFGQLHSI